jgi:hypothetical protein
VLARIGVPRVSAVTGFKKRGLRNLVTDHANPTPERRRVLVEFATAVSRQAFRETGVPLPTSRMGTLAAYVALGEP